MKLEDLDRINAKTRARVAARQAAGATLLADSFRYFGFMEISAFECPPFILFTSDDTPVVSYFLAHGTFEPQSLKLWCRLARTATGILDIGANVGVYAICAAMLRRDLAVHAFEPNPYAYARLRLHKEINELPNIIEHIEALGPENTYSGFGWIKKPGGNIASGAGFAHFQNASSEKIMVPVMKLDGSGIPQTLGDKPVLKMDVEGAERFVFEGMKEVVALRPDIILETFDPVACAHINERLLPLGYDVYLIDEKNRRVVPRAALEPTSNKDPDHNLNQFLTVRPAAEVAALAGE